MENGLSSLGIYRVYIHFKNLKKYASNICHKGGDVNIV